MSDEILKIHFYDLNGRKKCDQTNLSDLETELNDEIKKAQWLSKSAYSTADDAKSKSERLEIIKRLSPIYKAKLICLKCKHCNLRECMTFAESVNDHDQRALNEYTTFPCGHVFMFCKVLNCEIPLSTKEVCISCSDFKRVD